MSGVAEGRVFCPLCGASVAFSAEVRQVNPDDQARLRVQLYDAQPIHKCKGGGAR